MLGLDNYGSGSDSDDEQQPQQAPVAAPKASVPAPVTRLPNPLSDAKQPKPSTAAPLPAPVLGQKRPVSQVAGSVLVMQPGDKKAPKKDAVPLPAPATGGASKPAAMFVPPQVRGRPNVVTEDLEKMGIKRGGKPAGGGSGPASTSDAAK